MKDACIEEFDRTLLSFKVYLKIFVWRLWDGVTLALYSGVRTTPVISTTTTRCPGRFPISANVFYSFQLRLYKQFAYINNKKSTPIECLFCYIDFVYINILSCLRKIYGQSARPGMNSRETATDLADLPFFFTRIIFHEFFFL